MGRELVSARRTVTAAIALVAAVLLGAQIAHAGPPACTVTRSDALGPFYRPNAPTRSSVGTGHILTGVVRSVTGCHPLPGARIEFWLVGPGGQYGDDFRATVIADGAGRYRFESHIPAGYTGRPPHIHIRITAERHQTLVTQYHLPLGQTQGTLDLVLAR